MFKLISEYPVYLILNIFRFWSREILYYTNKFVFSLSMKEYSSYMLQKYKNRETFKEVKESCSLISAVNIWDYGRLLNNLRADPRDACSRPSVSTLPPQPESASHWWCRAVASAVEGYPPVGGPM